MLRLRTVPWPLIALLAVLAAPTPSSAQYFGRNKVQYERFDWRVMRTQHFDVHFYPAESLAASDAGRMAERWYSRLSVALRDTFDRRSLVFYANSPDFQQTNVVEGEIGQGTGGVTESLRGRVVMPIASTYQETDHVVGHELVHVFQYNIAFGTDSRGGGGMRGLAQVPLWVMEGMAEYLSMGRRDSHTAMWLRDAMRRDDLPTLRQLTRDQRYFPYRYGQAFWAWFAGVYGDQAVERVYRTTLREGWENALRTVTGRSADSLSAQWHRDIRTLYEPLMGGRVAPDSIGEPVITARRRMGDANISPVLSPDGSQVAFFSSRDLFGFALYIADVATGNIVRQLTSLTTDQHFDQLSFITNAGTWSPDGSRFAFIVFAQGSEELNVVNVQTGRIERRISVAGVGAISDPAWSPDGSRIVFSGSSGGLSNLYLVELESGASRQLTSGRPAALHPSWSPDGRTIAYSTEAGPNTDLQRLVYGELRLALLDVQSGETRFLPTLGSGRHLNPHFSPDGRSVFFVADPDGFTDIYRMELASGEAFRVTRAASGVSGYTRFSPAMSIAARTGRLAFSVFHQGTYSIRTLGPDQLAGTPFTPVPPDAVVLGALLPPAAVQPGQVARYLADPATGLPSPSTQFPVDRYRPRLSLDYIGVPTAGLQVGGPFGTVAQGQVAAYFADELNDRVVGTSVTAQGTLQDIGGEVFYLNRERRWNWLVGASRTPLLSLQAQFGTRLEEIGGQQVPVDVYQQLLIRIYYDALQGGVRYPLSTTRRLELNAGAQRISYSFDVDEIVLFGNQVIRRDQFSAETPPSVTLGQMSAAYVGDYSFFGFTSPIAGGRYRFEVSPTFGDVTYQSALADWRRYLWFRPFTFAMRGLHFGRYGSGADDPRLQPLFLGYPTLVRGYEQGSFDPTECTPTPQGGCPEFSRLVGSRVGVANLELRVPLLGVPQLGLINFPFLPTELSLFADAGVAWDSDESPVLRFEQESVERVPVVSAGISTRVNLLGYLVLEFYYARPFQRPERSGVFGFHISPGW